MSVDTESVSKLMMQGDETRHYKKIQVATKFRKFKSG